MAPWVVPAIMAGTSLIGGLIGGKKSSASKAEKQARARFEGMTDDLHDRGVRFSDEYERRALEYDPYESMRTAIEGTWDMMLPKMRGKQASLGRLRTGFAGADESEQLQHLIASKAQTAEQRQLEHMHGMGQYGASAFDRAMEARFGQYATERESREKEAASRRGMWGNILGGGMAGAGAFLGSR